MFNFNIPPPFDIIFIVLKNIFGIYASFFQRHTTDFFEKKKKKPELKCVTKLLSEASNPDGTSADLEKGCLARLASPSSVLGIGNL